jgi:formylglycine-generating enzyme required for sulfatase activity
MTKPKIFICYRRKDADAQALMIYDHIQPRFGKENVFLDIDRIRKGRDFRKEIDRAIGESNYLIAVIGRSWSTARDEETGQRRLDDPDDWVRLEIGAALKRDIPVIPVLWHDVQMPTKRELPEDLWDFAYCEAHSIHLNSHRYDIERLIEAIEEQEVERQREAEEKERARLALEPAAIAERKRLEQEAQEEARAQRQQEEAAKLAEAKRQREQHEAEEKEKARLAQDAALAEKKRLEEESQQKARRERERQDAEKRAAEQLLRQQQEAEEREEARLAQESADRAEQERLGKEAQEKARAEQELLDAAKRAEEKRQREEQAAEEAEKARLVNGVAALAEKGRRDDEAAQKARPERGRPEAEKRTEESGPRVQQATEEEDRSTQERPAAAKDLRGAEPAVMPLNASSLPRWMHDVRSRRATAIASLLCIIFVAIGFVFQTLGFRFSNLWEHSIAEASVRAASGPAANQSSPSSLRTSDSRPADSEGHSTQVRESTTLLARPLHGTPVMYGLRRLSNRKANALRFGGSGPSESAVEASLHWLASVQTRDGYWSAKAFGAGQVKIDEQGVDRDYAGRDADSGVTGLAVLAFLGAGYTHEEGQYAANVERALRWLITQQQGDGNLGAGAGHFAMMYSHGIATYAIAEAYGMQNDTSSNSMLRDPLLRAVHYILENQNPDGGWRYAKGQLSDMSMFGWQFMGLKSAEIAGMEIPSEAKSKMIDFLRKRSLGDNLGLAGYREDESPSPSMTAEALFCKQMLGLKRDNTACREAVQYLLTHLPKRSEFNEYYWYYGTVALYRYGGTEWHTWNDAMREILVSTQENSGEFAGSWNPIGPWAKYGGRIYSTALSTLCLEVYYRLAAASGDQLVQDRQSGKEAPRTNEQRPAVATTSSPRKEPDNSLDMQFVLIPAGHFSMGSRESPDQLATLFPETASQHFSDEHPVREVTISKSFYLGKYEVTRNEFSKFVAATKYKTDAEKDGKGGWGYIEEGNRIDQRPNFTWESWGLPQPQDDKSPVVNVSYRDAVSFCEWLSATKGRKYRLPTEAEWEYACRARTTGLYYNGDDPNELTKIGKIKAPGPWRDEYPYTWQVGKLEPNNFGLYDMIGNVREWCSDGYAMYSDGPVSDPTGPIWFFKGYVVRGGGWNSSPVDCRSAFRSAEADTYRQADLGFRVVLVPFFN